MKTARDVIDRIIWDDSLDPNDFVVGYEDRFEGTMELEFTEFNWDDDFTALSHLESAIPQHRITYFLYKEKLIWDKPSRTDLVFGSQGQECIWKTST